jgi:hypothetical protein
MVKMRPITDGALFKLQFVIIKLLIIQKPKVNYFRGFVLLILDLILIDQPIAMTSGGYFVTPYFTVL